MKRGSFLDDFPVTAVFLLLLLGWYSFEVLEQERLAGQGLLQSALAIDGPVLESLGANSLRLLKAGEVWRLFSHAFLHASLWHLLFNAWVLLELGRFSEALLGRERYTVVALASAVVAGAASALHDHLRPGLEVISVGFSGALLGLAGLLLGHSLRHRKRELRAFILRWVIYVVVLTLVLPLLAKVSIDHASHAGGFLTGAAFGLFTPRYVDSRAARRWRLPFWGASLLAAAALLQAFLHRYQA
jgi:membrane associated rhomboid family serine protease